MVITTRPRKAAMAVLQHHLKGHTGAAKTMSPWLVQ